jgi:hypothetical protein
MSVTNSVFHSGISEHLALAQRGGAVGSSSALAQWGSVEQHFSPDGTAARHASTAVFSAVLLVNMGAHIALVSTRSVHDVTPSSTYPVLHVGTQDVPLTRVSVQLPTAPLRGARDASHASSMRVHPPPGRVSAVPPSNLACHAFA